MTRGPGPVTRPRRWLRTITYGVVLLLVAAFVASRISLDYYVLSPGAAQSVGPLIKVPAQYAHPAHGRVLLTDVFVAPVSALQYLPDKLSGDDQLVPTNELTGGRDIPITELTPQGYLEMVQAKDAAKTAALRHLGYSVPEHAAGTVIVAVGTGTPSYGVLKVAQVVTAVNGTPTPDVCAFVRALSASGPGTTVRMSVQQNRFTPDGKFVPGPAVTKTVPLVARPPGLPDQSGCPGVPASKGYLGVAVDTQQDFTYPFPITIQTPDIGGPSAGLAMTLGLLNTLSGGHLTGGRVVAATGTIAPGGAVGDVGGVAQKTVAVERAGATVFFVPGPELEAARSKAAGGLRVYAVNTLAQALAILGRLGGHVPPAPAGP
ncbi:MAG: S16 family serine protease [Acidimicrobiales bacterium]